MQSTLAGKIVLLVLALSFALISIALFSGQSGGLTNIMLAFGVHDQYLLYYIRLLAAGVFSAATVLALLSVKYQYAAKSLGWLMLVLAVIPLCSLLGGVHWISSLGGFPAIGSGQGVIKYFALLALAVLLLKPALLQAKAAEWISVLPVVLVLLWIGGMKYTDIEARGIQPLVESSPFMAWLYSYFDYQQVSNIIGTYDLLAALLLVAGIYIRGLFWPGFLMSLAVLLTTQSFLLSFTGAWADSGVLSSGGIFIIKDLWYIATMILLAQLRLHRR
ncbi:MAG TPA: DUF417 family protein [Rheinheimera sp.]|nr:DUF417 family protein [Rheinheimera sp.]